MRGCLAGKCAIGYRLEEDSEIRWLVVGWWETEMYQNRNRVRDWEQGCYSIVRRGRRLNPRRYCSISLI